MLYWHCAIHVNRKLLLLELSVKFKEMCTFVVADHLCDYDLAFACNATGCDPSHPSPPILGEKTPHQQHHTKRIYVMLISFLYFGLHPLKSMCHIKKVCYSFSRFLAFSVTLR